nr:HD domain-containing phosphohydrolase [Clostridium caldaquaticum]
MAVHEYEKKRLADETIERYKELNILYNVSEKIATTVGITNVGKVVLTEAMKYIDSTFSTIMLLDEQTEKLEVLCQIDRNLFSEKDKSNKLIDLESSIIKNTITKKTGEIINNVRESSLPKDDKSFLFSFICTPIMVKSKIVGVMLIGHEGQKEYTASDFKLFNSLAFQAGTAIEGAKLFDSLKDNFFDTVQVLSQIIEIRDSYKVGRTQAVINYSLNIGRAMGMSGVELVKLKLAVMLHDIGNVAISDEVLAKRGKLSEEEFEIVKKHSEIGANMLNKIDQLKDIVPSIRAHHERYDGSGYPDGLKGEEIPLMARIISVAEAFEAMTNDRPYREAMDLYFAFEELLNNRGKKFDPEVVDVFYKIYKEVKVDKIESYVYTN